MFTGLIFVYIKGCPSVVGFFTRNIEFHLGESIDGSLQQYSSVTNRTTDSSRKYSPMTLEFWLLAVILLPELCVELSLWHSLEVPCMIVDR